MSPSVLVVELPGKLWLEAVEMREVDDVVVNAGIAAER